MSPSDKNRSPKKSTDAKASSTNLLTALSSSNDVSSSHVKDGGMRRSQDASKSVSAAGSKGEQPIAGSIDVDLRLMVPEACMDVATATEVVSSVAKPSIAAKENDQSKEKCIIIAVKRFYEVAHIF